MRPAISYTVRNTPPDIGFDRRGIKRNRSAYDRIADVFRDLAPDCHVEIGGPPSELINLRTALLAALNDCINANVLRLARQ